MSELQRLRADHAAAVLEFEMANRTYFATSISDRGDEFFDHFAEHFEAWLSEQKSGAAAYHVLVDPDGAVLGRFNLILAGNGSAELGYRVAERAAGRGVATTWVRELCDLATAEYGLQRIRAATSLRNVASQRVLTKVGFALLGPADPNHLGGKPGVWFELELG